MVEYVVFQKRKIGDQPVSGWYLWGTVDETTRKSSFYKDFRVEANEE